MSNITPEEELKAIEKQVVLNKDIEKELHKELSELESLSRIKKHGSNIAYKKMTIIRSIESRQIAGMSVGDRRTEEIIAKFEGLAALTRAEISVIKRGLLIEAQDEEGIKRAFLITEKEIKQYEENLNREKTRINLIHHSLKLIEKRLKEVLLEQLLRKGIDSKKAELMIRNFETKLLSKEPKVMAYFYTEAPNLLKKDRNLLEECAKDFKMLLFRAETRIKLEKALLELLQKQMQVLEELNEFLKRLNKVEEQILPDDKRKIVAMMNVLYSGTENAATGGLFKKELEILEKLNNNIFLSENEQKKLISEKEEEGYLIVHIAQILNRSVGRMTSARQEALHMFVNRAELKNILGSAPFGNKSTKEILDQTSALLQEAEKSLGKRL